MSQLINKILWQKNRNAKKGTFQKSASVIGVFIGVLSLFLSTLIINDINYLNQGDQELFDENTVIIQKKVTKFTSVGLNSTEFSDEDIQVLKSKDFILDLGKFQSSNFTVGISEYPGDGLPPFYADMFLQSVPDRFIDVDTDWNWNSDAKFVPIILPRQFLLLVNYGIAQSQNLPQISEDLLSAARLKLHLSNGKEKYVLTGKVVGLSHKISSILVPNNFLTTYNQKLASNRKQITQRLFIKLKEGSHGEFESLIEDMNLDINQQDLLISKIKTIIFVIAIIFFLLALIIVFLAILNLIQFVLLLLNQSQQEISILFLLGYTQKSIQKVLLKYVFKRFGTITVLGIIASVTLKFLIINPYIITNGLSPGKHQLILTFFVALIFLIIFSMFIFASIKKAVKKL